MDIDVTPPSNRSTRSEKVTPRGQEQEGFHKRPSQSSLTQELPKRTKIERYSTPLRLAKHVILKYNIAKAIKKGVADTQAVLDALDSDEVSSEGLVSPFLFVPTKYWIDLEDPGKLFKVASSPREMPTWQMPVADHVRCGILAATEDPFSDQKLCNVRNAFTPVFLYVKTKRPYYRFVTSGGRNTSDDWVLLDRPFQEEKVRLESARSILQSHVNDIESSVADYTAAMSKWRSEARHWEVETIRHEIEAGNTVIFRNRLTDQDLEELAVWLEFEERKEADGQYDTWYCGVLRLGHNNVFPHAHLFRSERIKEIIDQRLESLHAAISTLGEMIKELESKPMSRASSGALPTPKPLVDLPDCSSADDETPHDEQHLANLTVWAYERHLHWIPRDPESRKKYKFKTEDDVYNFFQIKKLTCSDSTGSVGNKGLFEEHIRIPQDLTRYTWGEPFSALVKVIPLATHWKELYSEEGRTILRDMEAEYFTYHESLSFQKNQLGWTISSEFWDRIDSFVARVNRGQSD